MKKLSIVVPCYNEQESIPLYYPAVEKVVHKMPVKVEYIFVNDGSSDNTLNELRKLQKQDPEHVHYISFSRNFGKEAALYAGLKATKGDLVVVMDVDLQDPPEMMLKMYDLIENDDWDVVGCRRINRAGESKLRSFLSNMFYKVLNKISKTKLVPGVRDYRMMTRQVVNAVLSVSEYNRFSKGIFSWVGFNTKYLNYHNVKRVAGKSTWTVWQLFKYAMDGIFDFSQAPLNFTLWLGLTSSVLSFIGIIFIIVRHWIFPQYSVQGWSSLVCIILLIGGLQLLCIGLVGRYVGRIYLQVKDRPIYIIKEKK
ncbi:glycosyltransferase family 2 protein [Lactobacillus ultunensis]|uniref:Glycosyltransferase, group 2 family protein n=1 Tax=Lactobacillus ultunensis DSM 16047 TaxID=525365 RepID=C2ELH7_9LACO|nr:glycosyltransferase family 2 protein [Lactobacillus ultunensis]EEJ72625.1 glycosyltransferase, group 2 family protein [Lactobacillus ultunensis DSM 16047]KRL81234.1 undecaprenyl phosphate 4-deoxy-4-formamido-L-arabinose transferase [Lactobacillus ultunensis DSM 16047]QQP28179.1 glycosyltransferase family 2 protein [Lactobacillus ultunensis]